MKNHLAWLCFVAASIYSIRASDISILCGSDVSLSDNKSHTVYLLLNTHLTIRPHEDAAGVAFWSYRLDSAAQSDWTDVTSPDPYFTIGRNDELLVQKMTANLNETTVQFELFVQSGLQPAQFIFLIIGELPRFVSNSSHVVFLVENSSNKSEFQFSLVGIPTPNVWLRIGENETAVPDQEKFSLSLSRLVLSGLDRYDTGKYRLIAENCLGKTFLDIEIRVQVPATFITTPTIISAHCGSRVAFLCGAIGYPAPMLTWRNSARENLAVSAAADKMNYNLVAVQSNLTFDGVELKDGTLVYTCEAGNGMGPNVTQDFRLNISCVPSKCFLHVTQQSNDSFTIFIDKPELEGGSPVLSYSVTVTSDEIVQTLNTTRNVVTVSGLVPRTAYTLECRTRNKFGYGEVGRVGNTTSDSPGPVHIVNIDTECTIATVSYRLVRNHGSPVSEYEIRWGNQEKRIVSATPEELQTYKIENLQEGTPYTVLIRARNKFGWGRSESKEFDTVECGQSGLLTIILSVVASVAALAVLAIALIVTSKLRKKRRAYRRKSLEMKNRQIMVKKWKRQMSSSGIDLVMDKSQVTLGQLIGEGAFGSVFKGTAMGVKGHAVNVAIKACKALTGNKDIEDLLKECEMMQAFHHPNVLHLIGVCLNYDPTNFGPLILVPFMHHGDVKQYLTRRRIEAGDYVDMKMTPIEGITMQFLLRFCLQIASGMNYLVGKKVVHRDLAARNCMLNERLIVKVADFGLSRSLSDSDYYTIHTNKKLPVKWLAPECMSDHKFTHQSDVWAYGVTVWEIFGLGVEPYPGVQNYEIPKLLRQGIRLEQPRNCPESVYHTMESCWQRDPNSRPTFANLYVQLEEVAMMVVGYQDFDNDMGTETDSRAETVV